MFCMNNECRPVDGGVSHCVAFYLFSSSSSEKQIEGFGIARIIYPAQTRSDQAFSPVLPPSTSKEVPTLRAYLVATAVDSFSRFRILYHAIRSLRRRTPRNKVRRTAFTRSTVVSRVLVISHDVDSGERFLWARLEAIPSTSHVAAWHYACHVYVYCDWITALFQRSCACVRPSVEQWAIYRSSLLFICFFMNNYFPVGIVTYSPTTLYVQNAYIALYGCCLLFFRLLSLRSSTFGM